MELENQAATDADFESGYTDAPTEMPAATKEPEQKPVEVAKQEQSDPLKEIVARLDKFEKGHTTLAGKFGTFEKQIQTQLAAAKSASQNVDSAPTKAQMTEAAADPEDWANLKKQFPEWAAATEKIIDAKVGAKAFDQEKLDKLVAERVAGQTAAIRQEAIDSHLDGIVDGDWNAEVRTEAFGKWLEAQNDAVKALAESSKMTDAAKMLRLYVASKQAKPAPQPEAAKTPTRQNRFKAAVQPRGTGGHASTSSDLDDFEAGYKA